MKQMKQIFLLVMVSALLFSCSNSRYGHMKKVKVNDKVVVKKQDKKKTPAQEQVTLAEAQSNTVVEAPVVVTETAPVVNTQTVQAPASQETVATTPQTKNSTAVAKSKVATEETEAAAVKTVVKQKESKTADASKAATKKGKKSQLIALVLCGLVGGLGIHRFYLGYTWQGVVQLLTGGGCGIWWIIDLVRIITGDLKPKNGKYDETL